MYVGVCRLTVHVHGSQSLKEKRRVVRSLTDRVRSRFGASVAEVGGQDTWQLAVLGVSVVSGDLRVAQKMLDDIVRYAEEFSPEARITSSDSEVFTYED
jgi:hypothetical protein